MAGDDSVPSIHTPGPPLWEITLAGPRSSKRGCTAASETPPIVVSDASKMSIPRRPFGVRVKLLKLIPIRLPRITFPDDPAPRMYTPARSLPEMWLPSPGSPPPIRFPAESETITPYVLGAEVLPASFVPMVFPRTSLAEAFHEPSDEPSIRTPSPCHSSVWLAEMKLPCPSVPPTVLPGAFRSTPWPSTLGNFEMVWGESPMELPRTRLPVASSPVTRTPCTQLPEMTFPHSPPRPIMLSGASLTHTPQWSLPMGSVPNALVPIRFATTSLSKAPEPEIVTPPPAFPEMTLPAGTSPSPGTTRTPTRFSDTSSRNTPAPMFPSLSRPSAVVPIRLSAILLRQPFVPEIRMPLLSFAEIRFPSMSVAPTPTIWMP